MLQTRTPEEAFCRSAFSISMELPLHCGLGLGFLQLTLLVTY